MSEVCTVPEQQQLESQYTELYELRMQHAERRVAGYLSNVVPRGFDGSDFVMDLSSGFGLRINRGYSGERLKIEPIINAGLVSIDESASNAVTSVEVNKLNHVTVSELEAALETDQDYQRYQEAIDTVTNQASFDNPTIFSSSSFKFYEETGEIADADFLLTFMLSGNPGKNNDAQSQTAELLRKAITRSEADSGVRSEYLEDGKLRIIMPSSDMKGVSFMLQSVVPPDEQNLDSIDWNIGVGIDADKEFLEKTYVGNILANPFIDSRTGNDLLSAFNTVGLIMSEDTKEIFAENNEKRYGYGYAEITRELAKVVNDDSRSITSWFEGDKDQIRDSIAKITISDLPNGSRAAILVLDLVKQLNVREKTQLEDKFSAIPVTGGRVSMKSGSCKDTEGYYLAAAQEGKRKTVNIHGLEFYTKTIGSQTYINREALVFNGITVQPGAIFGRQDDGGYAMLRITMFAMDDNTAEDAFGAQYIETMKSL